MDKIVIDKNKDFNEYYDNDDITDVIPKEITGVCIPYENENLENTLKIKPIDEDKMLEDTITDLWGDSNV